MSGVDEMLSQVRSEVREGMPCEPMDRVGDPIEEEDDDFVPFPEERMVERETDTAPEGD